MMRARSLGVRAARIAFDIGFTIGLAGCTAIRPIQSQPPPVASRPFSHAELDAVLSRHVDEQGQVDYAGLKRDPRELELYYERLSLFSPDSHPELFPTEQDRLAYWIDAYNGAMLTTVVRYYPIASVADVPTPFPLSLVSDKAGLFVLHGITLGGRTMSFYELENGVVRERFDDPRIHFALNCASAGCPRLPRHAFTGPDLDRQLDAETRRFFAEERNLQVDPTARVVRLSSILDWYAGDFTGWMERHHPDRPPTLVEYVELHAPPERQAELAAARGYDVEFIAYDWALNDRARAR